MSQRALSHHRAGDRHGAVHDGHHDDRADQHAARRHPVETEGHHPDARPARRERAASHDPSHDANHDPRRIAPKDYTLGHGGWQVRIGPVAFWICVGTLVIMAGWAAVTATYFAFHDDVLARLIARQAAMQFAYEDRIADMRAQVDRVTSRQMLDQEQVERRLDQLAKRQAALEARSTTLGALTDPAITGSIRPNARGIVPREPAGAPKPSPDQRHDDPHRAGRTRGPARSGEDAIGRLCERRRRGNARAPAGFARPGRDEPDRLAQFDRGGL